MTAPNQKLATDVTEFNVSGQKLYLSACMDLYNGEIVAYRMARRPVFEMVSSMLEAALSRTNCVAGLIVHSDQGWHYKMQPYRAMRRATRSPAKHEPQGQLLRQRGD